MVRTRGLVTCYCVCCVRVCVLTNIYHQKSTTLPQVASVYHWSQERQQGLT